MKAPWRNTAIFLFAASLLVSGFAGEKLLAVTGETQSQLRLYTELVQLAHESYGDEVAYKDLVYSSIQGMLRALDPHTNFLTPESYQDMRERQQGSFYGLGILVSMRSGKLTVISPIEGTPAWRMGLRAGDVISTIEGESTETMALDEAVSRLKGPKGTAVNVHIVRRGLDEPLEMAITRDEIPQNTVRYAYIMDDTKTGYIRLTDFSRSTAGEMEEAIDKLKGEGMERLLLDLRSNGGGLLDQTVEVSGLFVPEHTKIVETRGRLRDSHQSFTSEGGMEPVDMPVVVLVNNGTASAAEILAGAIQDHDVGLVAGEPTWGKGLVQTVYNLSYGTAIALTTAKYYTPSGRLIQRDYSSYFDYYTHFENTGTDPATVEGAEDVVPEVDGAELAAPDEPEYSTDLGRTVYGGGGITPDVEVTLPEGPTQLGVLYAKNAFFDFAVDYESSHEIADPSWEPPADMLDRFRKWALENEVVSEETLDELFTEQDARDFAVRQIHGDIFNSAFGTEASHRVLARGDEQIQAALELFGEASDLLDKRRALNAERAARVAESGARGDDDAMRENP